MRCLLDTVDEHQKCRRCFEADADCVFLEAAPRQRRKRTDARVASLEKELSAMRSMFGRLDTPASNQSDESQEHANIVNSSTERNEEHLENDEETEEQSRLSDDVDINSSQLSQHTAIAQHLTSTRRQDVIPDILGHEIISKDAAIALYQDFVTNMLPLHPIIALEQHDTFETMRIQKPTLLLAIIAAASAIGVPETYKHLHRHLIRNLAEKVIIDGQKSLELLQAILVMEAWYCPPDDLRKLNFYQWIHIAGTMAMQIGIGGKLSKSDDETIWNSLQHLLDSTRVMFAVFIACSS